MVRDLVVERAAVERGETAARAAVPRSAACCDVCAGGLLPEPAEPAPALSQLPPGVLPEGVAPSGVTA